MKAFVFLMGAVIVAPATAQDYDPSLAAAEATAQTQFATQESRISNGLIRESVSRNNRNGAGGTSGQRQACARKGEYRAEFGAGNPKVQRLYGLCRGIGM